MSMDPKSVGVDERESFLSDRRGSVVMLFAVSMLVLCGMCAFAVDYSRALAVRSRMQASVDAAVLAADQSSSLSQEQVTANVHATFTYNMPPQFAAANITVAPPLAIANGYRVSATADVPTTFGRLLGINTIPVAVTAEAVRAKINIEIVLVLDNTGSMAGAKLSALQASAKKLVDDVVSKSTPGSVKFALVPFSNYVNIGTQYRSATWMSVPNNYNEPIHSCWTTTEWAGCPTTTTTSTCYNDGVPYSCQSTQCTTPGPPVQQCADWTWTHTWNGCAGSRIPAPDVAVGASFSSPVPGILDVGCPSPLTRLTNDDSSIKAQIDGMIAQGETYIPSGLMWGWRVLAPDSPFADGVAYNSTPPTKKIMILMTDGQNTRSQTGTNHEGWDGAAADSATSSLCTNLKALQIQLYTIAFEVTDPAPKALLQGCASPGSYYYDAQDTAALDAAFTNISGSLIKLALSK